MVNKNKVQFYESVARVVQKCFSHTVTEEDIESISDESIQSAIRKAEKERENGGLSCLVEIHNTANNLSLVYGGDTEIPKYIATMTYYTELPETMKEAIETVRKDGQ